MATIFGTSINDSATVVFPAAAKIEGVQGIALALADGKLSVPEAGKAVLGLSLFTNEENVEAGRSQLAMNSLQTPPARPSRPRTAISS